MVIGLVVITEVWLKLCITLHFEIAISPIFDASLPNRSYSQHCLAPVLYTLLLYMYKQGFIWGRIQTFFFLSSWNCLKMHQKQSEWVQNTKFPEEVCMSFAGTWDAKVSRVVSHSHSQAHTWECTENNLRNSKTLKFPQSWWAYSQLP